jgi:type IV pilus assembly protein PilB
MVYDKAHIIRKMLEVGLVDGGTVSRVLILSRSRGIDVLRVLVNYAGMKPDEVRRFAVDHFGLITVDLNDIVLNPYVVRLVPASVALEHRMIPAFKVWSRTHLAVSNPFDFDGINRIENYTGKDSGIFLAPENQVVHAIRSYFAYLP